MIEQLLAEGVTHVFGNPGTTEQAFMDALQEYPDLKYILALHEGVAMGVADGYARASGQPAFVQLHITPGLGNAMGMLYNSYRMQTPLVIYAGNHPQRGNSQEPILAGDLVRLAEPITKWAVEAQDANEIPILLRRAFKTAATHPRGPVFISVPANVMDEDSEEDIVPSTRPDLRAHPDPAAVERIAEAMLSARTPVIICGDGVAESGGQDELVKFAELTGAAVHSTFTAELPFPSAHPQYAGLLNVVAPAMLKGQLSQADVILAIGTSLMPLLFPINDSPFPDAAQVIHIDLDPWEIGKNWPVQIGLLADPRTALADLNAKIRETQSSVHKDEAKKRAAAVESTSGQLLQALEMAAKGRWDNVPIGTGRMMAELGQAMDPKTLLFDESITAGGYLMRYLRFPDTGRHYRATGGGLGPGIPNPIGIKLARPDRPVLSVVGDGASLYTIQGLWTAAHHKVPVTWVIANNRSYRILKLNLLEYLGEGAAGRKFVEMDVDDPPLDFSQIAAAFGVKGARVEHPDEVGDAVREAQASGEPRLVDVVIEGDVKSRWL
jgi:benzoylformate decarboxylase